MLPRLHTAWWELGGLGGWDELCGDAGVTTKSHAAMHAYCDIPEQAFSYI